MLKRIAVTLTALLAASNAQTYPLTSEALFYRCYGQLTQTRPAADNPLLKSVLENGRDPIDACMELLDAATLSTTATAQTTNISNNPIAKAVLSTMHHLHSSWFNFKTFPDFGAEELGNAISDLYDPSVPALYYTRALFSKDVPFSSIFTSSKSIIPIRTTRESSTGVISKKDKSYYVLLQGVTLAGVGDILGIEEVNAKPAGDYQQYNSFGGGVLGDPVFLLENSTSLLNVVRDGGLQTWRRYGKYVYQDLMCLDLPVVRESDVTPFVDSTSTIPFRIGAGCTKCHASIDRTAGVVRGIQFYASSNSNNAALMRSVFLKSVPVTMPSDTSWKAVPDTDYMNRPTDGVLYFRNHEGTLVDKSVANLTELGSAMTQDDAVYNCAAKRYYSYFLGVSAYTGDPDDPIKPISSSGNMAHHRENVLRLGRELHSDQNLKNVIKKIMNLPEYRDSQFARGD